MNLQNTMGKGKHETCNGFWFANSCPYCEKGKRWKRIMGKEVRAFDTIKQGGVITVWKPEEMAHLEGEE